MAIVPFRAMRMRGMALAVLWITTLLPSSSLAGAQTSPPIPPDLADRANWTTFAGGDEVLALAADPTDGSRLWAGTEGGGVVVWDLAARTFASHRFPAADGPAGNVVRDIAFGAGGIAWLATSGGVTRAGGAAWKQFGAAEGLPAGEISAIAAERDGTVWAGTRAGVSVLAPGAARWAAVEPVEYKPAELTRRDGPGFARVVDIAVDGRGDVYLAHGRGGTAERPAMSVFRAATGRWDHVPPIMPMGGGLPENGPPTEQVTALAFDAATGRLWTATWGRGVVYLDTTRGVWRRVTEEGLCGPFVWSLYAGGGAVWAGCGDERRGRGIARWDGAAWDAWSTEDGLPSAEVAAIAAAAGRVWLGTNGPDVQGRGIIPFDLEEGTFGGALSTSPRLPASNDIAALLVAPDGTLWAGTRGGGLLKRSPGSAGTADEGEGGAWARYTVASTGGGLAGDTVTDLAWRAGELWVAATQTHWDGRQYADGGVSRLNVATGAWSAPLRRSSSSLPDDDVSSLAVGPDGRVWIGVGAAVGGAAAGDVNHAGNGVAAYDPASGRWALTRYDPNAPRQLVGNTVLDLAIAGDAVWAAASYHSDSQNGNNYGGGVSRFGDGAWSGWRNGDAGLRTFGGDPGVPGATAFITGDVRSLAVTRDGAVWAGTWTIGPNDSLIARWPWVDAVVNRFGGGGGGAGGGEWTAAVFAGAGWATALAEDEAGRLWAGTTRGHDRYEASLARGEGRADDVAGLYVRTGGSGALGPDAGGRWAALDPSNSGIASNAITALAVDPATGDVWIGTENGGLSVFSAPEPTPTTTPTPSAIRTQTATRTVEPSPAAVTPTMTRPASSSPTHTPETTPTRRTRWWIYLPWARQRPT